MNILIEVEAPEGYQLLIDETTEGMKYKVEGFTYSGITQIKVLDKTGNEVINISGVSGIGGNTNIKKCFDFEDNDKEFLSTLEQEKIFSNITYKEFSLFGTKMRLTDNGILTQYFSEYSTQGSVFCEPIFYRLNDLGHIQYDSDNSATSNLYDITLDLEDKHIFEMISSLIMKRTSI